ncbi:MAG: hypothetical protein D6731_07555 [Planctomycetota bacterium]|nr:MAG: hypothetical protein D6731_07555 [Planctomycetota bacterium]
MTLGSLVSELVDERSLDALERLTGSRNEEVLEALIEAAGRILADDRSEEVDDDIVERIRDHLVDSRAVGPLTDALSGSPPEAIEFALGCLSEIGDLDAVPPMIAILEGRDPQLREAAAEHLALLTKYDFGQDAKRWREWQQRRIRGLAEQAEEDREDEARLLNLKLRGQNEDADRREGPYR